MQEHLALALFLPRLSAAVMGAFGSLALGLAAVGLFGLVSFSVSCRTSEVGIRVSLGAKRGQVVRMVVRDALKPVFVGGILGIGASFATTRFLGPFLHSVDTLDRVSFLGVPLLLVLVACLAAFLPARKAGKVDPLTALRMG
jgi:ABC-type antimicrobial peptide transport system permease subunit